MSGIGGNKREQKEFSKKVGLFEGKVIAINPDREELINLLAITDSEAQEKIKDPEYLGEDKEDGDTTLRVTFWVEDVKTKWRTNVSFFLKDKVRVNKDGTKTQFINNVGTCSWGEDKNSLPDWFTSDGREIREAKIGEEELYNFLRNWLSELDYRNIESTLELSWKQLMRGNVRELRDQINGEFAKSVLLVATINLVEKTDNEGEKITKEYQQVNNRFFTVGNQIKFFRTTNYDEDKISVLRAKKPKDLKFHEKFVVRASDSEYGIKEIYTFEELKDYNSDDHFVATNKVISDQDTSY